jgi:hypothetical protein
MLTSNIQGFTRALIFEADIFHQPILFQYSQSAPNRKAKKEK